MAVSAPNLIFHDGGAKTARCWVHLLAGTPPGENLDRLQYQLGSLVNAAEATDMFLVCRAGVLHVGLQLPREVTKQTAWGKLRAHTAAPEGKSFADKTDNAVLLAVGILKKGQKRSASHAALAERGEEDRVGDSRPSTD